MHLSGCKVLTNIVLVAGKLEYTVDKVKREIAVTVKDAPKDTDYNLRLCHKRSVICADEGTLKTVSTYTFL